MELLELTLASPELNLALDEALLERADQEDDGRELLRLWEPTDPMVVVGRASHVDQEVRVDECRDLNIPILRRCSGGTSIVTGPGCLMYAVVLSYRRRPSLRSLRHAHEFVMETARNALAPHLQNVTYQGTSDLAVGDQKFSGNSVRCKRNCLLYHGTVLYDFPLDLISRLLASPPRQPEYRQGRSHKQFLANVKVPAPEIRKCLVSAWNAGDIMRDWPKAETNRLARERYEQDSWNLRF